MIYSRLYKRENKRLLTILSGIGIFMLGLWLFLFIKDLGLKNGWEKTQGLTNLQVVNISSHGFDVVWATKDAAKEDQWVEWKSQQGNVEGKVVGEKMGDIYHSSIVGLQPGKTYTYKMRVGTKTYIQNNLAQTSVSLPAESKELPISPAYGKVLLPNGKPYSNGLLTYEIDGFFPIATFTKGTGEWLLPLTGLIEKKTLKIKPVSDAFQVTIRLFSYPKGSIHTTVGQTRPLRQAITAGATLRAEIVPNTEVVLGANTTSGTGPSQFQPSIIYPKERAIVPGSRPLMRGLAIPGKDVLAYIQGPTKQYSYRAAADAKGEWLIQYPLPLEAGSYLFSISTVDKNGFPLTLRRSFSIIKSGEQVLGTATGSPTLIPTSSIVPTNSPTIAPTLQPTSGVYPTAVPTLFIPTATPPITGGGMTGFAYAAVFCIVVGAGLVLAF